MSQPADDILVVDDDPVIVGLITSFLADHGYAVRYAADGWAAVLAIAERRPALLILDLQMPRLRGEDVMQVLQTAAEDLPVAIITAQPDKVPSLANVVAIIAKPFDLTALLACVAQHVPRPDPAPPQAGDAGVAADQDSG